MDIEILPLTDTLGAEIRGIDLARPVAPEIALKLRDAWYQHVLLLFRNQEMSNEQLKRSTEWLG